MIEATKFYTKDSNKMKRSQQPRKPSSDVPKLTSTPALKGKGKGRGKGKSNKSASKKPGSEKKSRSSPEREIVLDVLEEDVIDAESLSGEENEGGGQQQERDIEDEPTRHNPDENDKEDFSWKCQLLQYVKEYPLLYDKTNPEFKNKYARLAAWEEIATSLDTDVDTVKETWRDLCDYYRKKELKIILCPPSKRKSGSKGTGIMDRVERWNFYEHMSFYKLYLYLDENNTTGNVKHCKCVPKTPTVGSDAENSVLASTSSSSIRELGDSAKPDVRYCKNKKADFENKVFEWIAADTKQSPETLDEVDHALDSLGMMIRRDLNVQDRARILFELQCYVFEFISMRVDQQQQHPQPQQSLAPPVPVQQNPIMYTQDQNQPESYMSMLQPLQ